MEAEEYLRFIVDEMHTTVVATVDDAGFPVTCAIDMMESDENGLYFLTAKGKGFYERLKKRGFLSLTGIKGEDTLSCVSISVRGRVRELGVEKVKELFLKNQYMDEIYPSESSRGAICVFQIYEGTGEWFDLSQRPIERAVFSFGGARESRKGYFVTDRCIGCRLCYSQCPQRCIDVSGRPASIHQSHCLRCGNCFKICPVRAIEREG